MADTKKRYIRRFAKEALAVRNQLKKLYDNKYYNLFMSSFRFSGNENFTPEMNYYLMKKFWTDGKIAAFKIKFTDDIGFCPFTPYEYNYMHLPETVELVPMEMVPFIPEGKQIVNKDVVIGYILPSELGVEKMVEIQIQRIVQIEMILNTNLTLQNTPFLIPVEPEEIDQAEDIMNRILNNEVCIFTNLSLIKQLQSLSNAAPYIVDKLYSQKIALENELLTSLGLDNSMEDTSKDRLLVDQVNANNALINVNQKSMLNRLQDFCNQVNKVLGYDLKVEPILKPVESVHEDINEVEKYNENIEGVESNE